MFIYITHFYLLEKEELVAENEDVLDALNPQDRKKLIDRLLTDRLKVLRNQIIRSK